MLASSYPFWDAMWTMLVFFLWIAWFWMLFAVWSDLFRRHDIGGGTKTLWFIFTLCLPFLGVFVYLIAEGKEMTQRNIDAQQSQKAQFDTYVRETASSGGAAAEIERAKGLLDKGTITDAEFASIKQKALAA